MSTSTTHNDQRPRRTPLEQARHRHKTMQAARLGTALLGMVAGTLLVASGGVLIGLVIGGMAAMRLVMFLVAGRQRRQWEHDRQLDGGPAAWPPPSQWPPPSPNPGAPAGSLAFTGPHRLARREFAVAATTIGVDPDELGRDFAAGRSIAEVASAKGVAPATVIEAIVADATTAIDQARRRGRLAPNATGPNPDRLTDWATRLVTRQGPAGSAPLAG
jgi:hypothetical protein